MSTLPMPSAPTHTARVSWGPTIEAALVWGKARLQKSYGDQGWRDARTLLSQMLGLQLEFILCQPDHRLTTSEFSKYAYAIERRALREPISKIVGRKEFWSLDFKVTPDTLDPRPDSEALVEATLACFLDPGAALAILDLGTGSGCLLLSLLHEYPHARGTGVDISEKALEVAQENARTLRMDDRATFKKGSWGEPIEGVFDVIVSNPPYISASEMGNLSPEVALYDPVTALKGGVDGLMCYREIAPYLKTHLSPRGLGFLEIGRGQEASVIGIMKKEGLGVLGTREDLAGIIRCIVVHRV